MGRLRCSWPLISGSTKYLEGDMMFVVVFIADTVAVF